MRLGRTRTILNAPPRHVVVIYNPVSGGGTAKRTVDHMVAPIFKLSRIDFTVVMTEYAGFAVEYVRGIDPDVVNGLLIAGGDGLVHECVTGYSTHPDYQQLRQRVPIGICPSGTANAMAVSVCPLC